MKQAIDLQPAPLANGGFKESGTVEEINLLLEPSLLERPEAVAEAQGMAAASLIRRLLREYLNHPTAYQRISGSGSSHDTARISLDQGHPPASARVDGLPHSWNSPPSLNRPTPAQRGN